MIAGRAQRRPFQVACADPALPVRCASPLGGGQPREGRGGPMTVKWTVLAGIGALAVLVLERLTLLL